MSALDELTSIASNLVNPSIEEWKQQGKKVVGFLCTYVPEEILYAADILPVRLRAPNCVETTSADVYLSHLNVMQIFERALLRSGYRSVFTTGFNPKPRIEFAQPLSLGIRGEEEIALAELENFDGEDAFRTSLNAALPEGIEVIQGKYLPPYQVGRLRRTRRPGV